jgi:hypothetical protein
MLNSRAVALAVLIFGYAVLCAAPASSQTVTGVIAGTVKDTTGAVLPGVTVEVSSPALIEKVRTVVTDGEGLYKVVAMPPGVYAATFSLGGFSTVKREGIELTVGITATANAELRVGTISETVTVSSENPIVDVQNTNVHQSLTRDIMDNLPTARNYSALGVLVNGVVTSVQDFGGSTGERLATLSIHGSAAGNMPLLFDGMRDHTTFATASGANTNWVINNGIVQETTVDTAGMTSEAEVSGVIVNSIPKSGSNKFSATYFENYASGKWQATNFDSALAATGATTPDRTDHIWDVNPGGGGPIVRDRLWFYASYRNWGAVTLPAGAYHNANLNGWTYVPDLSQPQTNPLWQYSTDARVTWQLSAKNKIAFYGAHENRCWCGDLASATTSYEASNRFITPVSDLEIVSWSWPATNRVLVEAAMSRRGESWAFPPQPDVPQNRSSIFDQSTGITYGQTQEATNYGNQSTPWNGKASLAYVTGSHNLKVGAQWFGGANTQYQHAQNNSSYTFNNGLPVSVTYYNTPVSVTSTLNLNLGLFVQEQWTRKRLTVNAGLRFDYLNAQTNGGSFPARQYAGPATYAPITNVPNWKDLNSRLGFAYDLFGDGKTAIKWSLGRYVETTGNGIASAVNPALAATYASTTRTWTDPDIASKSPFDFAPDCDTTNPAAQEHCGPSSNLAFNSTQPLISYAPGTVDGWGVRNYNWETSVDVQRQLRQGLSVGAGYYRRWFGNFRVTNNLLAPPSAYTTYCITAPTNSLLPGGGGYPVCGLADINSGQFGQVNNTIALSDTFGTQTQIFDGVDVSVNARLAGGLVLSGGTSTGRTKTNNCYVINSPQQLVFCDVHPPFQTRIRALGTYPLPWDVRVSATFQYNPGPNITASYAAPVAQIIPSLGRPLSGGARTATVPLVAAGVLYGESISQMDLRLAKTIRVSRVRLQPQVDFYNLLNANDILAYNNTYGPAWQRPNSIMQGRILKFGAQIDW